MNKLTMINTVLVCRLQAEDKNLLIELIMRSDENGESYPSVERLCKVRGIKYTKNFKGADFYLPALVTKVKRGRRNHYVLNTPAIEGLLEAETIYGGTNTPATEGVSKGSNTPARADNTPAVPDNTPATEGLNTPATAGSNSSLDNTRESTSNNTMDTRLEVREDKEKEDPSLKAYEAVSSNREEVAVSKDSSPDNTPATAGVSNRVAGTYTSEDELKQRRRLLGLI